MKIYIMTDMEGVAGIQDFGNWAAPPERGGPGRYYDLGKELLTREVNAAIEGFCQAGIDDILVADGHGAGGINPILLDRRAQLLRGWPNGWPLELDDSFDAVAFVGQHAKAGTTFAHLAHTQSLNYLDLSINGLSIGELGQFALCAAELGIPTIFGSGDQAFCQEAQDLMPGIITVAVKRGVQSDDGGELDAQAYGRHNAGAIHLHPEVARASIEDRARAAAIRFRDAPGRLPVNPLEPPFERVTRFRPKAPGEPKTVDRATHATSFLALMNTPFDPEPLVE